MHKYVVTYININHDQIYSIASCIVRTGPALRQLWDSIAAYQKARLHAEHLGHGIDPEWPQLQKKHVSEL